MTQSKTSWYPKLNAEPVSMLLAMTTIPATKTEHIFEGTKMTIRSATDHELPYWLPTKKLLDFIMLIATKYYAVDSVEDPAVFREGIQETNTFKLAFMLEDYFRLNGIKSTTINKDIVYGRILESLHILLNIHVELERNGIWLSFPGLIAEIGYKTNSAIKEITDLELKNLIIAGEACFVINMQQDFMQYIIAKNEIHHVCDSVFKLIEEPGLET